MSERREIYVELSSETYAGTEFPAAGSCYIVRTAPDAIQAQARVAELEQALSEIEALTSGGPYSLQWLLRLMNNVNQIARRARNMGRME
jgi:hypothetical protein